MSKYYNNKRGKNKYGDNISTDYKYIFKHYKLVCNNCVNGGDCYSETYCEGKCEHKKKLCKKCLIDICGCCYALKYGECPNCKAKL